MTPAGGKLPSGAREGANAGSPGGYGIPPLRFLREVMDARGITREQLASRSGLSQPTITRVMEGRQRVRLSTGEKAARAVGVPVAALYDDLAYGEASGRLRLPPVTAGRVYGYPGEGGEPAFEGGGDGVREEPVPEDGAVPGGGGRQYVILHRDEWRALHEALSAISGRLAEIEEAVSDLATRPIAEFDVSIDLKERGQK